MDMRTSVTRQVVATIGSKQEAQKQFAADKAEQEYNAHFPTYVYMGTDEEDMAVSIKWEAVGEYFVRTVEINAFRTFDTTVYLYSRR